ncbi:MAG: sugar phosphate isomerase/epimerase [Pedosphaera sp.]|nr:sugar phosphate isomerase/epimerase [Pedosphaera sp.]
MNTQQPATNSFIHHMSRRGFCRVGSQVALGIAASPSLLAQEAASNISRIKMNICLTPGSIGVSANQREAIDLAARHGFDAVEPFGGQLASLSMDQIAEVVGDLKQKKLVWGAAGLPVEFRQDDTKFREGMKTLPKIAASLRTAGVNRVGTWLSPSHASLTYLCNFKQHAERLREVARVLADHGQRLGLEYVGTQTLRNNRKYPFIHTMAEMKELIAEIGTGNVGFVLDSWHWWTAGDTVDDLLTLKNADVVSVDLNDAPMGVPKDQQIDGKRGLPLATGVIEVGGFLNALRQISYDGPVRAEPFNKPLNDLDNDAACAVTIAAMRKAFAQVR